MNSIPTKKPYVAIACGGTGGHFFPGLAISDALRDRQLSSLLIVSDKEIDRLAVSSLLDQPYLSTPSAAFRWTRAPGFVASCSKGYRSFVSVFEKSKPVAVLAMGGFTSAAPVLAGARLRIPVFLHEANTVVGRANRFLSLFADSLFTGFPSTLTRKSARACFHSGTPARSSIRPISPEESRRRLGLDPQGQTLLVMGGSQGARAVNRAALESLGILKEKGAALQFIHLCGAEDKQALEQAYRSQGFRALVMSFSNDMALILDAADFAVSRSGASSLAEFAAAQLPSILIPYPHAADNHQYHNAKAFADTGAAILLPQSELKASDPALARQILSLADNPNRLATMRHALKGWRNDKSAETIVDRMIQRVALSREEDARKNPFRRGVEQSVDISALPELSQKKQASECQV